MSQEPKLGTGVSRSHIRSDISQNIIMPQKYSAVGKRSFEGYPSFKNNFLQFFLHLFTEAFEKGIFETEHRRIKYIRTPVLSRMAIWVLWRTDSC